MKSNALTLENFDWLGSGGGAEIHTSKTEVSEIQSLDAFEKGYKAGWDDSTSAMESEGQKQSAVLMANLSDLSFTYHEARVHMLQGIEGFLKQIVKGLLPSIAQSTLPELIWEQLEAHVGNATLQPMKLLVAPSKGDLVRNILKDEPGLSFEISEDDTLIGDQVFVKVGGEERALDLTSIFSEIEVAVEEFFGSDVCEERQANG